MVFFIDAACIKEKRKCTTHGVIKFGMITKVLNTHDIV